jgi:asparagine synthase (glutamine-hydrolysing)
MCGIAGIFKPAGTIVLEDLCAVKRMTELQAHRGPDDSGEWHDEHAALGFTRLAIIDLSLAGRQPMSNEDGAIQVVFNGEIYNYRELRAELKAAGHQFRSQSDTEVLIHGYEQWDAGGLFTRLRGMFAAAIYDQRNRKCILARDRYGIKPLYCHTSKDGGALAFASEVKTLVRAGVAANDQDRDGVIGFLLFGSVPAPRTSIQGVSCLLPGHYLEADAQGIKTKKYWDMRGENPGAARDGSNLSPDPSVPGFLRTQLEDAVARHLVSDVPVGIFLSGGVDSAGLVAVASRHSARLKTLTVVFDEEEFSEAAPAGKVAERFHTDHREVRVTADDFIAEVPKILAAMDQPTNDGVNTYFVSRAARQAGLTVVLSGLGGDEIFWGYPHYRWLGTYKDPSRWLQAAPPILRNPLLAGAVQMGRWRGRESWMRLGYLREWPGAPGMYLALRGFFAPEQICRLLNIDTGQLRDVLERYGDFTLQSAFAEIEAKRYMHDQLLRDTDVFSMAHSIEVRVPYLDHEVTACAAALPAAQKRPNAVNKPALVQAIGDGLVTDLASAKKNGFVFPFAGWMRKNAARLQELTLGPKLLDPATVRGLWAAFGAGRLHWSRAWATVVLGAKT